MQVKLDSSPFSNNKMWSLVIFLSRAEPGMSKAEAKAAADRAAAAAASNL